MKSFAIINGYKNKLKTSIFIRHKIIELWSCNFVIVRAIEV